MPNQDENIWPHADAPAETGPDYVALVIEWDDAVEEVAGEDITEVMQRPQIAAPSRWRTLVLGAGAIGALLFATWGIRRLRHA